MLDNSTESNRLINIPATEVLAKIKNKESVEYDRVIIVGNIDIGEIKPENEYGKVVIDSSINITNSIIEDGVDFSYSMFKEPFTVKNTIFNGNVTFTEGIFRGEVNFVDSTFRGDSVDFYDAKFCKIVHFKRATFSGLTLFSGATFCEWANFWGTKFGEDLINKGVIFSETVIFMGTKFRDVIFHKKAIFMGATFRGDVDFRGAIFRERIQLEQSQFDSDLLTFKDAKFEDPLSQEDACRRAKNILEKAGNREEAAYHFYREMDAKRKQKHWFIRYFLEYPFIQCIFGYGVHPLRLLIWFIVTAFIFAGIYWAFNGIAGDIGWYEYIWFSITTAVTPGYAGYVLNPGFQIVAGIEAIFGTFMWASFIATFARKYMR